VLLEFALGIEPSCNQIGGGDYGQFVVGKNHHGDQELFRAE
jgi:hypothetical protein